MHVQIALIAIGATIAVGAVVVPILIEEWKLVQEQLRQQREREELARRGMRVRIDRGRNDDDDDNGYNHGAEYKDRESSSRNDARSRQEPLGSLRKRSGYQLADEHHDDKNLHVLSDSEHFVLKGDSDLESPLQPPQTRPSIPPPSSISPPTSPIYIVSPLLPQEQSGFSTPTVKQESRTATPPSPPTPASEENEGTVPLFSPALSTPGLSEGGEWDFVSTSAGSSESGGGGSGGNSRKGMGGSRTGSEAGWEHL